MQSISFITPVIDKTINEINNNPQYDNLIVFIHGRGKHPQKAFNQNLLADLEKDYSAKVIMFHWPSWEGTYAFPTQKARQSAADFMLVLKALGEYKHKEQNKTKNIKFTLFSNSMGSIVLEQTMLDYDGSLNQLFDTIVISSSASLAKKHSRWVEKIDFSDNIYITINKNDKLLGKLGIRFIGKRLGKGLVSFFGRSFKKATNAHYKVLSEPQNSHRYYLHRDLKGKPVAKKFYDSVLNGIPEI